MWDEFTDINNLDDFLDTQTKLLGSLLYFTQVFYKLRTGREFIISEPTGRESHFLTICKSLTKVYDGDITRLLINIPPRYGKTELLIHFVAWSLANDPDSNFLYISYSHTLAKKQTQTIREIIQLPYYRKMFGIMISDESSAKDDFVLNSGGSVYAAGAGGTITGRGAGIMGVARFGGAIVIDDIHKPDEASSDIIREGAIDWYYNTLQSRLNNGDKTPIIFIGQRVHEEDLPAHLMATDDWNKVILPAIDKAGNALYPELHDKRSLLKMQELEPYVFAAQQQQEPQPAGGGLFKPEWFVLMEEEPKILITFLTIDTAETDKSYNDKTVFSFFGLYKIKHGEDVTDMFGLHWIDCVELLVEPAFLEKEFRTFYSECNRYKVKPTLVAIEKKSTGVTLSSVLKTYQGIEVMDILRTKASGSKTTRFIEMQKPISQGFISLPRYGRHTKMCVEHMRKITANDSHRWDDIADTLYDGVKVGLIDNVLSSRIDNPAQVVQANVAKRIMQNYTRLQQLKRARI
jgi:hypothetical protein